MSQDFISSTQKLTVVLGMHRSGTSLCSSLLSLLGLDMADTISPHESNPRGHWERWEIVKFNDRVLKYFGRDFYSLQHAASLPTGWWAEPEVRTIRDEIIDWLRPRISRSSRFGLKDPRICRLLPMWREVFAELSVTPQFIFCLRHAGDIAASLTRRDKFTEAEGTYRWLVYIVEAILGLGAAPVTILPYEGWFADPLANMWLLAAVVSESEVDDLALSKMVGAALAPDLAHRGTEPAPYDVGICDQLYRLLLANPRQGGFTPPVREAARLADGYAGIIDPLRTEIQRLTKVEARLKDVTAERDRHAYSVEALQAEVSQSKETLAQHEADLAKGVEAQAEVARLTQAVEGLSKDLAKATVIKAKPVAAEPAR